MFDYNTCCRLCLHESKLFLKCLDVPRMISTIKLLLEIDITATDSCSTKICKDCIEKITKFSMYRDFVINNQKTIKDYQNFQNNLWTVKTNENTSEDDDVVFICKQGRTSINRATKKLKLSPEDSQVNTLLEMPTEQEIIYKETSENKNQITKTPNNSIATNNLEHKKIESIATNKTNKKYAQQTYNDSKINKSNSTIKMKPPELYLLDEIRSLTDTDSNSQKTTDIIVVPNSKILNLIDETPKTSCSTALMQKLNSSLNNKINSQNNGLPSYDGQVTDVKTVNNSSTRIPQNEVKFNNITFKIQLYKELNELQFKIITQDKEVHFNKINKSQLKSIRNSILVPSSMDKLTNTMQSFRISKYSKELLKKLGIYHLFEGIIE